MCFEILCFKWFLRFIVLWVIMGLNDVVIFFEITYAIAVIKVIYIAIWWWIFSDYTENDCPLESGIMTLSMLYISL